MAEIAKNVQERRFKWYRHVMRREEHDVGRRAVKSTGEKEERKT